MHVKAGPRGLCGPPSGYEHSQHSSLADLVCYLPFDSAGDARRFIDLIRPDVAVLVRYDIWPNDIWELGSRRVPILMASATLSRQTLRRLPLIRGFHRTLYDAMSEILTVSEADAEVFRSFNASVHIERVGDTRCDQVVARSLDARKRTAVPEEVLRGRKVLVAGSSWPEDDAVLVPALEHLQQGRVLGYVLALFRPSDRVALRPLDFGVALP